MILVIQPPEYCGMYSRRMWLDVQQAELGGTYVRRCSRAYTCWSTVGRTTVGIRLVIHLSECCEAQNCWTWLGAARFLPTCVRSYWLSRDAPVIKCKIFTVVRAVFVVRRWGHSALCHGKGIPIGLSAFIVHQVGSARVSHGCGGCNGSISHYHSALNKKYYVSRHQAIWSVPRCLQI